MSSTMSISNSSSSSSSRTSTYKRSNSISSSNSFSGSNDKIPEITNISINSSPVNSNSDRLCTKRVYRISSPQEVYSHSSLSSSISQSSSSGISSSKSNSFSSKEPEPESESETFINIVVKEFLKILAKDYPTKEEIARLNNERISDKTKKKITKALIDANSVHRLSRARKYKLYITKLDDNVHSLIYVIKKNSSFYSNTINELLSNSDYLADLEENDYKELTKYFIDKNKKDWGKLIPDKSGKEPNRFSQEVVIIVDNFIIRVPSLVYAASKNKMDAFLALLDHIKEPDLKDTREDKDILDYLLYQKNDSACESYLAKLSLLDEGKFFNIVKKILENPEFLKFSNVLQYLFGLEPFFKFLVVPDYEPTIKKFIENIIEQGKKKVLDSLSSVFFTKQMNFPVSRKAVELALNRYPKEKEYLNYLIPYFDGMLFTVEYSYKEKRKTLLEIFTDEDDIESMKRLKMAAIERGIELSYEKMTSNAPKEKKENINRFLSKNPLYVKPNQQKNNSDHEEKKEFNPIQSSRLTKANSVLATKFEEVEYQKNLLEVEKEILRSQVSSLLSEQKKKQIQFNELQQAFEELKEKGKGWLSCLRTVKNDKLSKDKKSCNSETSGSKEFCTHV